MKPPAAAIPIGITARDEARNIVGLLKSMRVAVARACAELPCRFEIHVLLNDNRDHTPDLLAAEPDVRVWQTTGGIVEAQRFFALRYAAAAPFLVFSDADILVDPNALLEVARAMLEEPAVEVAYAEKHPVEPKRGTHLARALYLYNLREGYQTKRNYCNGQFFAIRHWCIPKADELHWHPQADTQFLNLAAGIRIDDIYLSREILRRAGPGAIRCVKAGIRYRAPETLRGMYRKYQRMRLELERLDLYFPEWRDAHSRWGRRSRDAAELTQARFADRRYYDLFCAALLLCKIAYRAQRWYYTHLSSRPCPTWLPVDETKEPIA